MVSPDFLTKLLLDQYAVFEVFERIGNTVFEVFDTDTYMSLENPDTRVLMVLEVLDRDA
jgi:hypothetical protein